MRTGGRRKSLPRATPACELRLGRDKGQGRKQKKSGDDIWEEQNNNKKKIKPVLTALKGKVDDAKWTVTAFHRPLTAGFRRTMKKLVSELLAQQYAKARVRYGCGYGYGHGHGCSRILTLVVCCSCALTLLFGSKKE